MALLITLSVITLLIAVTLEANRLVRATVVAAAGARDQTTLSQMAASGIQVAMAFLIKDRNDSDNDSLGEAWANPEKVRALARDIPFDDAQLRVKINDEMGRIQVNGLVDFPEGRSFNEPQRQLWERFLQSAIAENSGLDENDATMIINSIKDWLDSGDDEAITGLSGAESDYYGSMDPPYESRNGPLLMLSELERVRGITRELLYGNEEFPGIIGNLTAHGLGEDPEELAGYSGRININTAELPVIRALLPEESADLAEAILDYRRALIETGDIDSFSDPEWYKGAPGLGDVEIDPNLVTVSSDTFRIESTAAFHGTEMSVAAVVFRQRENRTGKWGCRILRWQRK